MRSSTILVSRLAASPVAVALSACIIIAHLAACQVAAPAPEDDAAAVALSEIGLTLAATPSCPVADPTCVPVADPKIESDCSDDRWISYEPGGCPGSSPIAGWNVSQLFADVGTNAPHWGLPPGLANYCLYEWSFANSAPPPSAINDLHEIVDGQGTQLQRDCAAVQPMSSEAVNLSWEMLHDHVREHTGALDLLPHSTASSLPQKIRVAVIDSLPTGDLELRSVERGGSVHGWGVARTIEELSCPAPGDAASACAGHMSAHQALPLDTAGDHAPIQGGSYGRISDVARAIVDSVNAWRIHNHSYPRSHPEHQPRLLVNLSVAWEPRFGGVGSDGPGPDMSAPSRSVYAALAHLRCWGGVAIAAAGNDGGGPDPSYADGPMPPAAWEAHPAPDAGQCASFEGGLIPPSVVLPRFPATTTYDPLVYAVGAVRGDDLPIAVTRPDSRPRMAALGAHVVAIDDEASAIPSPTAVQTGTSMAAAVLSGIAVAAWSYAPGMPPADLLDLVYERGTDLTEAAELCRGGGPCADVIRRIDLCNSVAGMCARIGDSGCASALPVCQRKPAGSGALPIPSEAMRAQVAAQAAVKGEGGVSSAADYEIALPPLSVCGHSGFQSDDDAAYPMSTCPFQQWGTSSLPVPHASPQPPPNPCPACWASTSSSVEVAGDGTTEATTTYFDLYISIDPDYPYSLTGGTLSVSGYGDITLSEIGVLDPGDEAVLTDIPVHASGPFTSASVSFRTADYDKGGSIVTLEGATSSELVVFAE